MTNQTFPTDFTTKSNPVDADLLIIADSEDGNEMKKITVGSITADIGDGLIVDGSASSTTTYSSDKINTLNTAQDSVISGLATTKLTRAGQLRTGNWAWKTVYNNGSGDEVELALWAATRVLTSGGTAAAPTWEVPTTDVVSLTEDTAWDMDADFLLAYDNSATANRKQKANVYRASSAEVAARTATNKFTTPAQLPIYTNWQTTKNAADASTTQNIAHGLGIIPKFVSIEAICKSANTASADGGFAFAKTFYNWTTQSSIANYPSNGTPVYTNDNAFTLNAAWNNWTQVGVVTFDATNIIITWTKTGSPTGTFYLLWSANT